MNTAYLLTGGNLGNREETLRKAYELIEERCGKIRSSSSIYETMAWGVTDQPAFYNQALELATELSPAALMRELLQIEHDMGRVRERKMGPRTIDIDIIQIDDIVLQSDLLTLPHPFMEQRRFVLAPLCEIAPDLRHPVLGHTVSELLAICPDTLDVQKK